jgi:predicted DsbA family dithiol-disulfide isomerase
MGYLKAWQFSCLKLSKITQKEGYSLVLIMKIEIWSDIACPFCYIGKLRLEEALEASKDITVSDIIYKSYQLAPHLKITEPTSLNEYLAKVKGISIEQAKEMNAYVSNMASEVGLRFTIEAAQLANTFNAHRFLHLAKSLHCQVEAKERLMKAYFCDGMYVDQLDTFLTIAQDLNIDATLVNTWWLDNTYEEEVRRDIYEAQQYQISGVPLFLFNERIAVSGAQPLNVLANYSKISLQETILVI